MQAVDKPAEYKCEILGVVVLGITAALCLSLLTLQLPSDPFARFSLDNLEEVSSLLGKPGGAVAYILTLFVGDAAHVLYGLTFIWGLMLLSHRPIDRLLTRFMGLLILLAATAGLLQVNLSEGVSNPQPGGAVGSFVADQILLNYFGIIGSSVIGATLALIGILLATDLLFVQLFILVPRGLVQLSRGGHKVSSGARSVWDSYREHAEQRQELRASRRKSTADAQRAEEAEVLAKLLDTSTTVDTVEEEEEAELESLERIRVRAAQRAARVDEPFEAVAVDFPQQLALEPQEEPRAVVDFLGEEMEEEFEEELEIAEAIADVDTAEPEAEDELPVSVPPRVSISAPATPAAALDRRVLKPRRKADPFEELPEDYEYPKRYTRPSFDLLDIAQERIIPDLEAKLRVTGVLLEETLQTFGIEARVTDVTRGPTITRFELEPAPGIKVSRFLALADDIALALKAHRVRVEAPIPGKGRVGIEVPNQERDQVLLRELLESPIFQRGKGKLNLALGKDIAGDVQIADLATMPHLLVAGATGAGKTVCVKALLASLLFSKSPDELQLMLIDPKMVELSILNDIPHLITPVVIDPKKAASALSWLINEMEERYRLFADLRVRNIEVYNQSVENGEIEMTGTDDALEHVSVIRKLPYIVCVIDELADLMMLARAEVEDAIARLAQLARAVGIHLIIATQRPSVDVLTGVIKANFPARISFQVSSRVDSRCILDEIGAERLIGMGDMLYLPAGQSKPSRIQGAFVSDDEMNALIVYLKTQAPPQYRDEIENFGKSKDKLNELVEEDDPLFEEAVQVVLETGQASISMVQRRLRVGYTRAARLIDMMELKGIVGPHTGSKAREILVSASHQGMT